MDAVFVVCEEITTMLKSYKVESKNKWYKGGQNDDFKAMGGTNFYQRADQ